MLLKCNDCGGKVSDKALFCPHCGYPLDKESVRPYKNKERRSHKRLPNGFGQISKIKGNLRKPYRAMITVGKDNTGKPVCRLLKPHAYFRTYNEAYTALIKYHENPYDIVTNITCKDLYDMWSVEHFDGMGSGRRLYVSAWGLCDYAYNINVRELRVKHIKICMQNASSPSAKANIKLVFGLMLDFAVEHEMVERNVARDFKLPKNIRKELKENYKGHTALTEDEVSMLRENIDDPYLMLAYVQVYTGFRPSELLMLSSDSFDKEAMTITGGMKTKAGKNRTVPIHPAIENIVFEIEPDISYETYRRNVMKSMKRIGITDHRPHDFRKTFVTLAKKYGADEYAIKRIVGHSISDLTEAVYTERDVYWLHKEIRKIPTL